MSKTDNLTDFLTDIANAIREKKGTTDLINPQNFSTEIANLSGGSGGDVVTVSFYNHDGSWLYDKPTIKGDDCVDVVAKGLVTPTKESDNYYNYAFSGWSKTNDNTVDSGVFGNITEDVSLYACYSSSTRYYTVNFYSDGVLEDTVQVTYGQTASHKEILKDGYKISGYEPSNENITDDTNINIQWIIDDGMIHDDWDAIASYCDDGSYATRYKVGDRKNLDITYADGTTETIPMRVVQLDSTYDRHTDDYANSYAKLVFIADNLLKDSMKKQYTTTDSVYWNQTDLYDYLNGDFLTYLPQTLQSSIVDVGAGSNTVITDANKKGKVWIPSLMEMWNYTYSSGNFYLLDRGTGAQYTEYSGESVSASQYNVRRFTKVGSDTVEARWFRNSYRHGAVASFTAHIYDDGATGGSPVFRYVERTGQSWDSSKKGVLIGFCIG